MMRQLEQVSLDPSAMAVDGSGAAANVSVAGGNKVKLKDGRALFKSVRIEAEAPGVYTLHAKSASRKVSTTARTGLQRSSVSKTVVIMLCYLVEYNSSTQGV